MDKLAIVSVTRWQKVQSIKFELIPIVKETPKTITLTAASVYLGYVKHVKKSVLNVLQRVDGLPTLCTINPTGEDMKALGRQIREAYLGELLGKVEMATVHYETFKKATEGLYE